MGFLKTETLNFTLAGYFSKVFLSLLARHPQVVLAVSYEELH
jgi:hypothetical protein